MSTNYMESYIQLSNEFRKSGGAKKCVENLYDLLYVLEKLENPSKQEINILSNVYRLLGYHYSAYKAFESIADKENKKEISNLFVLKQKAESHKDNFAFKDLRKSAKKLKQISLTLLDFKSTDKSKKTFSIARKGAIVLNKPVKEDCIKINFPDTEIENYLTAIIDYLQWLGECKNELIEFYNNNFPNKIDDDWYNGLEIYNVAITFTNPEEVMCNTTGGDNLWKDHLLDIEIDSRKISSISYDG